MLQYNEATFISKKENASKYQYMPSHLIVFFFIFKWFQCEIWQPKSYEKKV